MWTKHLDWRWFLIPDFVRLENYHFSTLMHILDIQKFVLEIN